MIRTRINDNWKFEKGSPTLMSALTSGNGKSVIVNLPHDAMVHEERTPDTANGTQTGYFPGGTYTYTKVLHAPEEWADKTVTVEFEGVYESAMVYLNDNLIGTQHYGYSNFYVSLDKFLNYGEDNILMVIANNEHEKNSRWYSGSGIYRDVNLMVGNLIHIVPDGVKIDTPSVSAESSTVEITATVTNASRKNEKIQVVSEILYAGEVVAADSSVVTMFGGETEEVHQRVAISGAKLWDDVNPNLYQLKVELIAGEEVLDECEEAFGIRRLELDAEHGLRMNGRQVKLRGSCIHHDNGVIGAATLPDAEDRRCRQMKEAGFNAIRSAHHPMSRAMLAACDKYGMLVMDEFTDMWTKHKNNNDYAYCFLEDMETEVTRMVEKDYNHPSVVIYSVGNEIPEVGTARGAQINRRLCNLIHRLDSSRFTTNAINGLVSSGARMGSIIQDVMAQFASQEQENEAAVQTETGGNSDGANAVNSMMAMMLGSVADAVACHPLMTETVEETCQSMDICGFNYLTGRHELEKQIHPNKTVLGTETFPGDIVCLWDIVERNDHVLGDFTWTGYDYIGEAGSGTFYYDGTQNFAGAYPDRLAYMGDINLIGYRRPISYLREIVYGLRHAPYIAVERVDKYGMQHSQTAWMWKDNVASWTWPGYEGKPANVDVYSDADEVELFLNGKSLGRKPAGKAAGFTATYEMTYEPGELVAVSYTSGVESGRDVLKTAGVETVLTVDVENETLRANGEDLAFITVRLTDEAGEDKLFEKKVVTVSTEGAGTLQGFGNADPRGIGSYDDTTWETFDGYVMAVVRAGTEAGNINVSISAEGCETKNVTIKVR